MIGHLIGADSADSLSAGLASILQVGVVIGADEVAMAPVLRSRP